MNVQQHDSYARVEVTVASSFDETTSLVTVAVCQLGNPKRCSVRHATLVKGFDLVISIVVVVNQFIFAFKSFVLFGFCLISYLAVVFYG